MNSTGGNLGPIPRREQQHPGCNLPARAGLSPADTQIVCCFLLASTRNSKLPDNFISNSLGLLIFLSWQLQTSRWGRLCLTPRLCHSRPVDSEIKCALWYISSACELFHIIALPSWESSSKRQLGLELGLAEDAGSANYSKSLLGRSLPVTEPRFPVGSSSGGEWGSRKRLYESSLAQNTPNVSENLLL